MLSKTLSELFPRSVIIEICFPLEILKKTGSAALCDFEKASIKENHTKNIGQCDAMLFFNPNGILAKKVREKLNLTL